MPTKSIRWGEQDAGSVIVEQWGNKTARLFGLPFLAIAGYLLYQFGDGAWHGDLTAAGFVLLPLFAAAFLVPGWILTIGRRRHVDAQGIGAGLSAPATVR